MNIRAILTNCCLSLIMGGCVATQVGASWTDGKGNTVSAWVNLSRTGKEPVPSK